jgi:hypothetical protein
MSLSIDAYYTQLALRLPDEELKRQAAAARRLSELLVRTRKDLAYRQAYCFECELRRRAAQRDERNPGLA